MKPSTNPVKSAARALAILELFDNLKTRAPAGLISDHLKIPVSSTSALLRSLTSLGYLSYDTADRTYSPTLRVAFMGDWLLRSSLGNKPILQLMEHLSSATGEMIAIATRSGLYSQYIYVIQATNPVRHVVRNGALLPLVKSASGWMLLSPVPERRIKMIAMHSNAQGAITREPVSPQWLVEQVDAAREAGHAYSYGQVNVGAGAVATLLPDMEESRPMALIVGGVGETFVSNADRYVELMHRGISAYLSDNADERV
jgi:DNA-binding IclR family transcriptional regulator